MKFFRIILLANCIFAVVLSHKVMRICFAQAGQQQTDIDKAQEFYRAGQRYMLEGNFTAANNEFMKAEVVLKAKSEFAKEASAQEASYQKRPLHRDETASGHALEPDIYYNLGVGALQKGDFIQAEAAFLRVIELMPLDKDACYNLGVLYENTLINPARQSNSIPAISIWPMRQTTTPNRSRHGSQISRSG